MKKFVLQKLKDSEFIDEHLKKVYGINSFEVPKLKGLIIYPDPDTKFEHKDGEEDDQGMIEMKDGFRKAGILSDTAHIREIPGFKDFYKIAVPLPESPPKR